MDAKYTKFIDREEDADPSGIFEMRARVVTKSIIAFAYGTYEDGSPKAIGTGFKIAAPPPIVLYCMLDTTFPSPS